MNNFTVRVGISCRAIDVSKYQGDIDFEAVKRSGIGLVMVRAVSSNSGGLYVDPYFVKNVEGFRRVGICVGAYVYSYANSISKVEKEINFLLNAMKGLDINGPVAYDMEYEDCILELSNAGRTDIAIHALDMIENAGYYAMMYCSENFINNLLDYERMRPYDLWVAAYKNKVSCKIPYGMWQYSSTGVNPGVSGNVDLDYCYKDYEKIIKNMSCSESDDTVDGTHIVVGPMSCGDYNAVMAVANDVANRLGNIKVVGKDGNTIIIGPMSSGDMKTMSNEVGSKVNELGNIKMEVV